MTWKLALAQHPMYFLIREDGLCAERTPPWGAPDIDAYLERLRLTFAVLRQNPRLKIGFEWSALELELLAHDAPTVFQEMLALARQHQITFYNGTYSQPHLQILSAEANYRQFEFGLRVYRELCGRQVITYAHQETSLNEQTPQLLQAFGLRYAVLPHFMATLVPEGGELIFHPREGMMFVQGSEFALWRGLDGTTIPTYLPEPAHRPFPDWLAYQAVKGSLQAPPLIVESPDLIAIDEAWLAERSGFDFVLLDEALPERLQQAPPRFQARLYANWSYLEGLRAEELSRANWLAERRALQAEAMGALAFALIGRPAASTQAIWKTILTTQHHDVYCFCGPDLKRKSIGWLREAEQQVGCLIQAAAEALLPEISRAKPGAGQVVVFNTLPQPAACLVTLRVPGQTLAVTDLEGRAVPSEIAPAEPGHAWLSFVARAESFGYRSYLLTGGGAAAQEELLDQPLTFENQFYRAVVRPDGGFSALQVEPGALDLLDTSRVRGNQLAATDSTGLGSQHVGTRDVSKPQPAWVPPVRGAELVWEATGPARVRHSPLGVVLTADGRMGHDVQATATVQLYRELPWIALTWTLSFDQASLGSFFDDDSKLRVQWPLAFRGQIRHDIAFGVTTSLEQRPFFPASWVDVSDGQKGLAYFHQGTPKHWVQDDVLVNLFAWGENTDAIGNRLGARRWPKSFDQRLNGLHTLRAGVYPHAGDWRSADVPGVARSFASPLLAYLLGGEGGGLPASLDVIELLEPGLAATSVRVDAGQVAARVYSHLDEPTEVGLRLNRLRLAGLYSLRDEPMTEIGSFQIATLRFEPEAVEVKRE